MADCLPNAAELVDLLRRFEERYVSEVCGVSLFCNCLCENEDCIVIQAADAIEQLLAENAKLKAERDAAIADINDMSKRYGAYCRYCKTDCAFKSLNGWCSRCIEFEWRGVQPDETCTSCSLDDLWEQIEKKNGGC